MEWLMAVSNLVAKEGGDAMAWITPLGLPVVQPYRRRDTYQVQTLLQGVHIREEREDVPVSVARQKSAFPPNFVHSLDSTHMMMTAVEMTRAGMPFAAVHDSYWVHAGNVDRMNWQLRQVGIGEGCSGVGLIFFRRGGGGGGGRAQSILRRCLCM